MASGFADHIRPPDTGRSRKAARGSTGPQAIPSEQGDRQPKQAPTYTPPRIDPRKPLKSPNVQVASSPSPVPSTDLIIGATTGPATEAARPLPRKLTGNTNRSRRSISYDGSPCTNVPSCYQTGINVRIIRGKCPSVRVALPLK
jgi:hypothetical protein